MLNEEVDIATLIHTGVIQDFVNLHERKEQANILKCFVNNQWGLIFGFCLLDSWRHYVKALDYIADYFGEKFAFYFTWLIHYTSWLMFPSLVGLIIYATQITQYFAYGEVSYVDSTDSILNPCYSIFIALWTTFFVESWK